MKKRILSLLICLSLIISTAAGCADTASLKDAFKQHTSVSQTTLTTLPTTPASTTIVPTTSETTTATKPEKPVVKPENDDFSLYDIPVLYEDPFAPERTSVKFSEIVTEEFSEETLEQFKASAARMEELCGKKDSMDELKNLYAQLYDQMQSMSTARFVAQVNYYEDMNNKAVSEKYETLTNMYSSMDIAYYEAVQKVLASDYGEEFAAYMGEDVAEQFDDEEIKDPERLEELVAIQTALLAYYDTLISQGPTVEVNGTEWTYETFEQAWDEIDFEEYMQIYDAFKEELTEEAAEIYIELIDVRKEIVQLSGGEDIISHYYGEVYKRDYSPEDAESFHEAVKKYIVPVYTALEDYENYADAQVDKEDIIPVLCEYIPKISHEMEDILSYMLENEMYLLVNDADKSINAGYTTKVSAYAQPFIYNFTYGTYRDISDTVHEFGHYCDLYLNGIYGTYSPDMDLDLAEVSSTGLELLFYDYYDEIFSDGAEEEKADLIICMLGSLVNGCMYDEAQQRIYEYEGELTAEVVNRIFSETAEEYGRVMDYGSGPEWIYVHHNFRSPLYYISYAAASAASLEIWLTGRTEGQDAAIRQYLEILSMGSNEYGYFEVIEECEMEGFTSDEFIKEIAEATLEEVDALLESA